MQLNAQLKLAFAAAAYMKYLTLLHNVTRWPVLQKVRGHTRNVLPQFVSTGFQVLFHHPLPGFFSPFPHGQPRAIGHRVVFSLGGWSLLLPTGFHVSRGTLDHIGSLLTSTTVAVTLLWRSFPTLFVCNSLFADDMSATPNEANFVGSGLFRVRSPLLSGIDISFSSSGH